MIALVTKYTLGVGAVVCMLPLISACTKDKAPEQGAAVDSVTAASPASTPSAVLQPIAGNSAAPHNTDTVQGPHLTDDRLPVVTIDQKHQSIDRPGNPDAPRYYMTPGDGFILDASQYKFPDQENPAKKVNAVQVLFERGGGYSTHWGANPSRTIVRSDSLKPLQAYTGDRTFPPGTKFEIVVGHEGPGKDSTHPSFTPVWLAYAIVTK